MHPGGEHDAGGNGRPARHVAAEKQRFQHDPDAVKKRGERDEDAGAGNPAQRLQRKRGDANNGQLKQARIVELAFAGLARCRLKRQVNRFETDPGVQPFHEALPFRKRQECGDDFTPHDAEIARVRGKRVAAAVLHEAVETALQETEQAVFVAAFRLHRRHHVRTLTVQGKHFGEYRHRMLAVGIHHGDRLAARRLQSGA